MNYPDYETTIETEPVPWGAPTQAAQWVPPARSGQMVPANTRTSDMLVIGSLIQSVQQTQQQQMYLLRELDARLVRMENSERDAAAARVPTFERTTWWAIWGLLMLILGGALTIMIVLILTHVNWQ